uniref:hydroxymethylpyrimidine kinase n=1 Tax=candidate division WOR-3 bacterium TaxID=2052148 RepID=A0A7C4UBV0_UNCW3
MERKTLVSIAGFDPTGLAGILRDIQVFQSLGFHGAGTITALTIQSTKKVLRKKDVDKKFIFESLDKIDLKVSGIKIGMLNDEKIGREVLKFIEHKNIKRIVIDPVIFSTSKFRLLSEKGVKFMIERLLPLATCITPNLNEGKILTGEKDIEKILKRLSDMTEGFIVLKNIDGSDLFYDRNYIVSIEPFHRLKNVNMHGSGCVYSSALLSYLAKDMNPLLSAKMAKKYTEEEILSFIKKPVD